MNNQFIKPATAAAKSSQGQANRKSTVALDSDPLRKTCIGHKKAPILSFPRCSVAIFLGRSLFFGHPTTSLAMLSCPAVAHLTVLILPGHPLVGVRTNGLNSILPDLCIDVCHSPNITPLYPPVSFRFNQHSSLLHQFWVITQGLESFRRGRAQFHQS